MSRQILKNNDFRVAGEMATEHLFYAGRCSQCRRDSAEHKRQAPAHGASAGGQGAMISKCTLVCQTVTSSVGEG